jgi:hypothetical protein
MTVEIFEIVALCRNVIQSKALLFRGDQDNTSFCFNKGMISEADPKGLTGDCFCRRSERLVELRNGCREKLCVQYPYCKGVGSHYAFDSWEFIMP